MLLNKFKSYLLADSPPHSLTQPIYPYQSINQSINHTLFHLYTDSNLHLSSNIFFYNFLFSVEFYSVTPTDSNIFLEDCPKYYVVNLLQMFFAKQSGGNNFQCLLNITQVDYFYYLSIVEACNNSQKCIQNVTAKKVDHATCEGETTHILIIYNCVPGKYKHLRTGK